MQITKNVHDLMILNFAAQAYGLPLQSVGNGALIIAEDRIRDFQKEKIERDFQIIKERERLFNAQPGIRIGDYIVRADGSGSRVTHIHKEAGIIQDGGGPLSFHLCESGRISYSGGLNVGLPVDRVKPAPESRAGFIWIFSGGWRRAHWGIDAVINFRVFIEQ